MDQIFIDHALEQKALYCPDLELPSWFPDNHKYRAMYLLSELASKCEFEQYLWEEVNKDTDFIKSPHRNAHYQKYKEELKIAKANYIALTRLYINQEIMKPIWRAIFQLPEDKWGILPYSLFEGFNQWKSREQHTRGEQKKIAIAIVKKFDEIETLLNKDSRVAGIFNYLFWGSLKKQLMRSANSWAKAKHLPKDIPHKMELYRELCEIIDNNRMKDRPRESAYLPFADYLIRDARKLLAECISTAFIHEPNGMFPKKIATSEKIFFIRTIAQAIEQTFAQPRYAMVADILSIIRQDCQDITEDDIRKNLPIKKQPSYRKITA